MQKRFQSDRVISTDKLYTWRKGGFTVDISNSFVYNIFQASYRKNEEREE